MMPHLQLDDDILDLKCVSHMGSTLVSRSGVWIGVNDGARR
jgi:hypothetical protein